MESFLEYSSTLSNDTQTCVKIITSIRDNCNLLSALVPKCSLKACLRYF